MASCLCELHIWSLKGNIHIPDENIGCFQYHEKAESSTSDHPYLEEKAVYTEGRNVTWTPKNKRPDKVKDTLKEVEDLLAANSCVQVKWVSRRVLQMFLSNGIIISFILSIHTGDVDRIFIDKSLVFKLASDAVTDVLWTDSYLAVVYGDKPKMDYFYFGKRLGSDPSKKFERLSSSDPKLLQVELPGPLGRKLDRKLVSNLYHDWVLCWWPMTTGEAQPWSPMTGDRERSNIVLFLANGPRIDLIAYSQTDCDPLGISFSLLQQQQLLTVEQSPAAGGEINVDNCVYELTQKKIRRIATATIPSRSRVLCYDRTMTEDKVILGCEDGSLILYDGYKKLTCMTTAALVPHQVKWHPSGTVMVAVSSKAEIQVLDLALAPLLFQLVSDSPAPTRTLDISPYFRVPQAVSHAAWSPTVEHVESKVPECNDSIFIAFKKGPMMMLQYYLGALSNGSLSALALVNQYLKHRQLDEAVNVLCSLSWQSEGQMCYACLCAVANQLLRMPLNTDREAQLEAVLGAFYAPARPLSEVTVLEYRDPISKLARRFFHHLLRFGRFEKAFLLAVDIGSRDLFMDLHYIARDKGESALAEVSKKKANQIDADRIAAQNDDYTDSEGSRESFSESDEDTDEQIIQPPPRPPRQLQHSHQQPAPTRSLPPSLQGHQDVPQRLIPAHYMAPPAPPQQMWQQQYMDVSEATLQELESQLASQLEDEYTEALLSPSLAPASPNQPNTPNRTPSTIKVIHFGAV